MISVVIPAHNESLVIARILKAIVTEAVPGELDVIVVCNGCNDNTAEIAGGFGPPVRVIETKIANKAHALNLGDQAALTFPRVYADADVEVTLETIRDLARYLEQGDVMAVAPCPKINLSGCSRWVRAYYDIRSRLPSAREGIGGSGVYALSHTGRRRFGDFPNITADDGYVRIHFKSHERKTVMNTHSTVFAPRTISDLIKIRTRAYFGTNELANLFPELWKNRGEHNHRALVALLKFPSLWVNLMTYYYVNLIARRRAIILSRTRNVVWQRDDTSRSGGTVSAGASD